MGVLLALASAVSYGLSDFAGGLLSRRASFAGIALWGQLGGLLVALLATLVLPSPAVTAADLAWGALSGIGTGLGMLFLFRGLGRGAMSVVVPLSAVGGVSLPVLVGVVFLGERPSALAWLGVLLALPALWLVSGGRAGKGVPDGLLAGTGIALQYLALAEAGPGSGAWPVVAGRVAAVGTIMLATRPKPARKIAVPAAATGGAAALALVCYLAATRHQLVVVAVVLSSLYPAIPVLLGLTVLHERLSRRQLTGLGAAAAAVTLLAVG
ncbi:drug/metabolite transporter (DMT)-like permease [Amycolatopsis bartoniae]|uniref:Multidrug transporter n=1 Tax=Amycolatopsis bartoniae TaxID=941986 RepID=A0A8H9IX73_9PSEU|nr:EamA family transporter [Amycolatopsis bartoniae]MBB2938979.1 drug/metabolite transporter (DMT)-like permease [Amycolatopsis bartoniae]TVT11222.1 EamA family transporter [Amycolatopsis bartoniae]GHF65796.1 multidrug transporter [Amycolatopsis bartoniae]